MSSTFADLGVPDPLVAALAARGIEQPFAVQALTIPDALSGRDVYGQRRRARARRLRSVFRCSRIERAQKRKPTALILAPTRELAAQISRELEPLAEACARRVYAVYGGVGYEPQRRALNRGVDVLVACPGRLEDLVQQRALSLDAVEVVVVDEADRMSDMGFLPAVKRLLDATPNTRQTLLFSATLDGEIGVLTRRYQSDPVRHDAGGVEPTHDTATRHVFWSVDHQKRTDLATQLVPVTGPTIVFCKTRRGADRLAKHLAPRTGVRTDTIHGGRSQNQRDRALAAFTDGRVDALVATDVAARGIHVDGVACVVHFDTAEDEKAYMHRSGRTARAGAAGLVVSFVPQADRRTVARMQRILNIDEKLTPPDIHTLGEAPARPVRKERTPQHAPEQRRPQRNRNGNPNRNGNRNRNRNRNRAA